MAFVSGLALPFLRPNRSPTHVCRTPRMASDGMWKPTGDRVVVRVDERETSTASGLFIAGNEQQKQRTGTVIGVAKGRFSSKGIRENIEFQVGDRVLWKDSFGAEEFEVEGKKHISLKAPSIVASWKGE